MTLVYNEDSELIKLFDNNGIEVFRAPCRNETVASNAWRYPDAGCPPGIYTVGAPEANTTEEDQTPMGPWFIPVNDIPGHSGIGIHGGGSCVYPRSMEPHQGWCPTMNCFRMQNADLDNLVKLIPNGGSKFVVNQSE